jgi:hypothetical protein
MAKIKTTPHVQLPTEQTRKQLSRAEREAKQIRIVLLAVGGVIALMALILAYGFLRQNVFMLNEPVANVNGETISTAAFQHRVRLQLDQANQQYQRALATGDQQTADFYQQQLADPQALGQQILQQMVDELLLKQGAKDFGVSVTPDEVQQAIEENLNYYRNPPTPAPTPTPRPTPTVTEPITQTPTPTLTPFPSPTPVTQEGFQQLYGNQLTTLSKYGFSEQEYRQLVELGLLGQKVRAAIDSTVPTTTEQIRFQYIRAEATDAPTVTVAISREGFSNVYQSVLSNTFPLTTVVASEADWLPMSVLSETQEFGLAAAQTVFSTPISQTVTVTDPTGTVNWTLFILNKGIQPLSLTALRDAQQKAEEAWLAQRRNPLFFVTGLQDRIPTQP